MAFYYPEGSFGPVCDLPPTDAEIAQRARFAVSDTERLGEDSERVVTLDLTGLYDSIKKRGCQTPLSTASQVVNPL